ncbi:uncharacterized protein LOC112588676 [Harpegnathos saltator]|uniref:uncharacterized protein LOC112588676 n=1 Tax=Harpegnathos saltator TaxID=610380 RepID=UPI000DBEE8AC|nr:uncharacterized protein LOC112588676 [Harpegnathos saltator]
MSHELSPIDNLLTDDDDDENVSETPDKPVMTSVRLSDVSSNKVGGKGLYVSQAMMTLNDNNIDYVHWDDPNELNLQTDQGKEFYNTELQRLVKKHGVNHYSIYSVMKASVVERFNRMLKNNMWKMFTFNGTYKWIDLLPRLIAEYNTRKHRTIGMRPIDVTPTIANKLLNTVYSIGQLILQLTQSCNLLADSRGKPIAGGFYEHELHSVTNPDVYLVEKVLRRQGDKAYVKWLGFDNSHNSWIQKDNVL